MVKLTMGQALLQWTQSVETLLLHSLNIPTTQACFSRSFISIHGKELSVGCFKSIVWKGFEVLLPEALYKTVSGPNSHKRTAEWGGANVHPPYSTKICSHSLLLPVTSNHRQFLDCHRSWACMVSALSMAICPQHYNVYKYFSQSCEKLTDAIKHSDVSGTSELFIIHFKWRGIIVQSAALFASTRTPYLHEFLYVCISSTVCLLLSYCDVDRRLFGKEKSGSGVAEAL